MSADRDETDAGPARQRVVGRRRWRVGAGAVAAVALAGVAAGVLVPWRGRAPAAGSGSGVPAAVPRRLDALVPYPSFGWLPPGFHAAVTGVSWGRSAAEVSAAPPGYSDGPGEIDLVVYARDACSTSRGPGPYAQDLNCPGVVADAPLLRRAPAVRPGLPAYWVPNGLAWQYAPQAWAVVSNGPAGGSTGLVQRPVNRPIPASSPVGVPSGPSSPALGGGPGQLDPGGPNVPAPSQAGRPSVPALTDGWSEPLANPPAAGIRAELLAVARHVRYRPAGLTPAGGRPAAPGGRVRDAAAGRGAGSSSVR